VCRLTHPIALACVLAAALFLQPSMSEVAWAQELNWYRGNTHCHSNRSGFGPPPSVVAAWYFNRGYQFLCVTDSDILTAPDSVTLPADSRNEFILIPSEEITGKVHATALNIKRPIVAPYSVGTQANTIRAFMAEIEKAGGILILNHPNYQWTLSAEEIRSVEGLTLFELYNAYPAAHNEGNSTHLSTEAMWDTLLTQGMKIYGVASDDASLYPTTYSRMLPGPGKGWVMVQARELTPSAICSSLLEGRFYATDGVLLSKLEMGLSRIRIEIDKIATQTEIAKGSAFGRLAGEGAKVGERIDIVGSGGQVLASFEGVSADFTPNGRGYIRARAVVTRQVENSLAEFCAWCQPIFINEN
jgi:hypothetical protein